MGESKSTCSECKRQPGDIHADHCSRSMNRMRSWRELLKRRAKIGPDAFDRVQRKIEKVR